MLALIRVLPEYGSAVKPTAVVDSTRPGESAAPAVNRSFCLVAAYRRVDHAPVVRGAGCTRLSWRFCGQSGQYQETPRGLLTKAVRAYRTGSDHQIPLTRFEATKPLVDRRHARGEDLLRWRKKANRVRTATATPTRQ